jgi:hypothetical protein
MKDEIEGPTWGADHAMNYKKFIADGYTYGPFMKRTGEINSFDFYFTATIDGMDYYTPNDEGWGGIIVIDHAGKIATYTSFYEMDDMEYKDSDYKFVRFAGKLIPKFKVPEGSIYNVTINGEA